MTPSRAALVLGAGLAVTVAAQMLGPIAGPPLYDGVVVQEPYRFLSPSPGQAGSPTSAQATPAVTGGGSPAVVAATGESPPQAQLIGGAGAFVVGDAATAIDLSIEPVPAPAASSGRPLVGNVYRVAFADQAGTPLEVAPNNPLTLTLRMPDGVSSATIAHFANGAWTELPTQSAGQAGILLTSITEPGDYALLGSGGGLFGLDPALLIVVGMAVVLSVLVLAVVAPRRGRSRPSGSSTERAAGERGAGERRRCDGRRRDRSR